jgi:hypothetical protein
MEHIIASFLASIILVFRNTYRLIQDPYKTMREIAKERDVVQILLIFSVCCCYFLYAATVRHGSIDPVIITSSAIISSISFITTFALFIVFIYLIGKKYGVKHEDVVPRAVHLATYSLLPTLTWFWLTSTLFVLVPPPRHATPLGILFSIFFIIYSLTFLDLRIMMLYVTIRFSLRTSFQQTVKIMFIYFALFFPYSLILYKLGLFRVPFI